MILSWRLGLVFVKGLKVGGTSLEAALAGMCGPDDVITPITPVDERARLRAGGRGAQNFTGDAAVEAAYRDRVRRAAGADISDVAVPRGRFYNHMPLREVAELAGPDVLGLQAVCVERHPYGKLLSLANFRLTAERYRAGDGRRADDDALRRALADLVDSGRMAAVRNIDRYRRPDGALAARVLRFERLPDDYLALAVVLGVPDPPALPHLKRGSLAQPETAVGWLDRGRLDAVNRCFAAEFTAFGYEPA